MSRTLSLAAQVAIYAQQSGEAILPLLTIRHPGMAEGDTIRFVINPVGIWSRGDFYVAFPCDLTLPDDTEDRPPQATLSVSNVDRRMTAFLESSPVAPTVDIELVLESTPDTVEVGYYGMTMREVKYLQTISGSLTYEKMANEGFPKGIFSPTYFPGMF